jgi:hypothetical protein
LPRIRAGWWGDVVREFARQPRVRDFRRPATWNAIENRTSNDLSPLTEMRIEAIIKKITRAHLGNGNSGITRGEHPVARRSSRNFTDVSVDRFLEPNAFRAQRSTIEKKRFRQGN